MPASTSAMPGTARKKRMHFLKGFRGQEKSISFVTQIKRDAAKSHDGIRMTKRGLLVLDAYANRIMDLVLRELEMAKEAHASRTHKKDMNLTEETANIIIRHLFNNKSLAEPFGFTSAKVTRRIKLAGNRGGQLGIDALVLAMSYPLERLVANSIAFAEKAGSQTIMTKYIGPAYVCVTRDKDGPSGGAAFEAMVGSAIIRAEAIGRREAEKAEKGKKKAKTEADETGEPKKKKKRRVHRKSKKGKKGGKKKKHSASYCFC